MKRQKISNYIVIVKEMESVVLFNTLTSSLVRFSNEFYYEHFLKLNLNNEEEDSLHDMGFLVDFDIDEEFAIKKRRRKLMYDDNLKSVVIAVTTECNARCYYCYENGSKMLTMEKNTADALINFIDKKCKRRNIVIQWFGGEPLYATDIIDYISEGLNNLDISFESVITTNGILINDQVIEKARNKWNIKRFQVPVDALNEEYNNIKNIKDSSIRENAFNVLIKNIHKLLDNDFHVIARVNFDPKDITKSKNVFWFLKNEFEGKKKFFAYPEPLTGKGFPSVIEWVMENNPYLELLKEMRKMNYYAPSLLKENKYMGGEENLSGIKLTARSGGCYATQMSAFAIDPEGYLYKCHRLLGRKDYACGSVYKDVEYNSNFVLYCSDEYCYDDCKSCKLLPLCHGGCKTKKELYGGKNGCIAIKEFVEDLVKDYVEELDNERRKNNGNH